MGIFLSSLLIVALTAGTALFAVLLTGFTSLNRYELKQRAQAGDLSAKLLYPIKMQGRQLQLALQAGKVVTSALLVLALDAGLNVLAAFVLAVVLLLLIAELLPLVVAQKFVLRHATTIAPPLAKYLAVLSPATRPVAGMLDSWLGEEAAAIRTKEELRKALDAYAAQKSEIAADEVRIIRHALRFSEKLIREVMTPRKMVVTVSGEELVGPVLLDELHKSGYSRFPVKDPDSETFIGILYLHDLVGVEVSGKVSALMNKTVYYVHEEMRLDHALRAFLKHNNHLFIVVNSFEEFVGVLSLEDVIEEIIGKEIVDEFDQHADLRAAAKSLAAEEAKMRKKQNASPTK